MSFRIRAAPALTASTAPQRSIRYASVASSLPPWCHLECQSEIPLFLRCRHPFFLPAVRGLLHGRAWRHRRFHRRNQPYRRVSQSCPRSLPTGSRRFHHPRAEHSGTCRRPMPFFSGWLPDLSGPADAVPHMAFLGGKPAQPQTMGCREPGMPGNRHGPVLLAGGDSRTSRR